MISSRSMCKKGACKLIGSIIREDARPISISTLDKWRKAGLPHRKFRHAIIFVEDEVRSFFEKHRKGIFI
mgnify:CR=1 FL=1